MKKCSQEVLFSLCMFGLIECTFFKILFRCCFRTSVYFLCKGTLKKIKSKYKVTQAHSCDSHAFDEINEDAKKEMIRLALRLTLSPHQI